MHILRDPLTGHMEARMSPGSSEANRKEPQELFSVPSSVELPTVIAGTSAKLEGRDVLSVFLFFFVL